MIFILYQCAPSLLNVEQMILIFNSDICTACSQAAFVYETEYIEKCTEGVHSILSEVLYKCSVTLIDTNIAICMSSLLFWCKIDMI